MVVQFGGRLKMSSEALVSYLDEEAVILDLKSENYYGLDEVGTDMLRVLTESGSVEEACARMLEMYDVAREDLERDLGEFVGRMLELGLIEKE